MRTLTSTLLLLATLAGLSACEPASQNTPAASTPAQSQSGAQPETQPQAPANGESPWRPVMSFEEVDKALANLPPLPSLSAEQRAQLAHVGELIAAPPLRPLPATMPNLRSPLFVSSAQFADAAGVVIINDNERHYSVLDLRNGQVISTGEGSSVESLSPNGRVFVAPATAQGGGAELRETQGGKTLMSLPGASSWQVYWIGDFGVVHSVPDATLPWDKRLVFRDLATGLESNLAVMLGEAHGVFPVVGKPGRYWLTVHNTLHEMAVERTDAGWRAKIVGKREWKARHQRDALNLSGDKRYHFTAQGEELIFVDLATGAERTEFLPGFRLGTPVATSDPDRFLLGGFFKDRPGQPGPAFLYSMSRRTLARVDVRPPRLMFVPSLRANVSIQDNALVPVTLEATGPEGDIRTVLGQPEDPAVARARQLAGGRDSFAVPKPEVRSGAGTIPSGSFESLAKGAWIVGFGVYEPKPRGGSIVVQVPRTREPVVLVLTSYEPVKWVVAVGPDANIRAVLLGGYNESIVMGTPAPQHRIGRVFAYQSDDRKDAIDAEVQRLTGRPLDEFHGDYAADTFTLVR